jgi:hypothetical protein
MSSSEEGIRKKKSASFIFILYSLVISFVDFMVLWPSWQ